MSKHASPEKQARSVVRALQKSGAIKSLGTARGYKNALTRVCEHVKAEDLGSLRDLTQAQALSYLDVRSEEVGQKQLDMERQAIQAMMHHLTRQLPEADRLPVIKSEHEQILSSRSYLPVQVDRVTQHQQAEQALATQIAYAAGLRAHELLTLRRPEERPADVRPARDEKFSGREGELYTVKGKGGLVREVLIPKHLAEQLEARRLEAPVWVKDREISYPTHYDIRGGNAFSSSFSRASERALGWSAGAHGLRHSYAQERMNELQNRMQRADALEVVSQELGHFRKEIAEVYLR